MAQHEPQNPSDRLAFEDRVEQGRRELVLVKHGRRYVFRCAAGAESDLLRQLGDVVRESQGKLDWFDAAVISHQIGQRIKEQIQPPYQKAS